jgi:hypothetical protein
MNNDNKDEIDITEEKQSESNNPDGNPNWQKGMESPNPKGRPKGSAYMEELREAIKEVEGKKKQKFFVRVMERAWLSDTVLVAVLKKFVPDTMRQEIEGLENIEIRIIRANDKQ